MGGQPTKKYVTSFQYKMMLTEFVRQRAGADDLVQLVKLLQKARHCMGLAN
jgi:hypothetical protein